MQRQDAGDFFGGGDTITAPHSAVDRRMPFPGEQRHTSDRQVTFVKLLKFNTYMFDLPPHPVTVKKMRLLGFPTRNVIIPVVALTGQGVDPTYMIYDIRTNYINTLKLLLLTNAFSRVVLGFYFYHHLRLGAGKHPQFIF